MGLISSESKALWEKKQSRRTTQFLSHKDSALLLQRKTANKTPASRPPLQPARKSVSAVKVDKGRPLMSAEKQRIPAIVEKGDGVSSASILGKRTRESCDPDEWLKIKIQEACEFRKKRKLEEDRLSQKQKEVEAEKRRFEEKEVEAKKRHQQEAMKKQKDVDEVSRQHKINQERVAARETLRTVERDATPMEDQFKVMVDFMNLIGAPPIKFPSSWCR